VARLLCSNVALTTAADVYAIGMIGAVLLTGDSASTLQLAAARGEIETLLVTSGVPASIAKALRLCLMIRAEQRPTAEQLSAFLDRSVEWWRTESELDAPAAATAAPLALADAVRFLSCFMPWHSLTGRLSFRTTGKLWR
jgi:hypothetical protein